MMTDPRTWVPSAEIKLLEDDPEEWALLLSAEIALHCPNQAEWQFAVLYGEIGITSLLKYTGRKDVAPVNAIALAMVHSDADYIEHRIYAFWSKSNRAHILRCFACDWRFEITREVYFLGRGLDAEKSAIRVFEAAHQPHRIVTTLPV